MEISIKEIGYQVNLGGIAGAHYATNSNTILNNYNTGNITSQYSNGKWIGGLVGNAWSATVVTPVTSCYNIGTVTSANSNKNFEGALIGSVYNLNISNCYYLTNSSSRSYGTNHGKSTIASTVSNKNSSELKSYAETLGTTIWTTDENINEGYPIQKWQKDVNGWNLYILEKN